MTNSAPPAAGTREDPPHVAQALAAIREALGNLRYGTISLTVHEGRVVQIEVTEKMRLPPS
ncbi:YezD family protein [Pedomonas sp. V897]|uniref:YezD family protein n=1 Tax=Pedomonas sp. V897 TaxID=3446482 RepID=UPI003EE16778